MSTTTLTSRFDEAIEAARTAVAQLADAFAGGGAPHDSAPRSEQPARWADAVAMVESVGRLADAARVRALDTVVENATGAETAQRLGFRSPVDAVAVLAGVSEREANARLRLAAATRPQLALTGAVVEPRHPVVAAAVNGGALGVEAAGVIARELSAVAPRANPDDVHAAEQNLVRIARGDVAATDPDDGSADDAGPLLEAGNDPTAACTGVRVSVEAVRGAAKLWGSFIDPDGAAPREQQAMRRRSLRFGAETPEGLVPVSGLLVAETGHTMKRLIEAHRRAVGRSVHFTEGNETPGSGADADSGTVAPARDPRTPEQARHDALAAVLSAASRAIDAPELSGLGPAVLVTTRRDALSSPDGKAADPIGAIDGADTPVSRAAVERLIETNGHQEVALDDAGAIVGVGSVQRTFTGRARRAIMARDGGCVIPGCGIPAGWTEIHHVVPDRHGGPTHTSNGVCLCWWHHSTIETGPWRLRMQNGIPQIRGPGTPGWVRARHHSATLRDGTLL